MQQKISISTCFDYDIPLEEQMKYVAEAGFNHISLGSNLEHSRLFDEGRTNEIKAMLRENGLRLDTIHFSKTLTADDWYNDMEKTMKAANELDCKVIVVHCVNFMGRDVKDEEDVTAIFGEVAKLEKLCKKHNVKAALENLCPGKPTDITEKILDFMADSAYIGFCYDSSHDQIDGPRPMRILEKYKSRLLTTHISDRIKPFTDHVLPGEGFVDFDEMTDILKSVSHDFPILLEVKKTDSKYKDTEIFLKVAYREVLRFIFKISE